MLTKLLSRTQTLCRGGAMLCSSIRLMSTSTQLQTNQVNLNKDATHELTFVESVDTIDTGPIVERKIVPCYELTNDVGMSVRAMAEGGNMVQVSKNGQDYIWDNVEGACYYGAHEDAFPLDRGLILHGGIRFAAVPAEHGLYYDTEWEMTDDDDEQAGQGAKSIVLRIQDTAEQRAKVGRLSVGQYNWPEDDGQVAQMTKYPVTNLIFTYRITLCPGEEFVRLRMRVENPTDKDAHAEAWLPMTFPIETDSQIISQQRYRWRRDDWVFSDHRYPNITEWASDPDLQCPLKWSEAGIFYDWPSMDGYYHAVNRPSTGQGVAYVTDGSALHFTKLWSWGDKANFDRPTADTLAKGRPATEYYEPWGSAFNFAFFQTANFAANSTNEWSAAILPVESGLTSTDNKELQLTIERKIREHKIDVKSPSTMYF